MTEEQYDICLYTKERYIELLRLMSRIKRVIKAHRSRALIPGIRLFGSILATIALIASSMFMTERDFYSLTTSTGLPILFVLTTVITVSYALSTSNDSRFGAQDVEGEDLGLTKEDIEILVRTYKRLVKTKKIYDKVLSRCPSD